MTEGRPRHVPPEIDDTVRELAAAAQYDEATALVIHRFGPEIMGLLVALCHHDSQAGDAYSLFCEKVWKALPAFRFDASVRTWAYVLARRAMADVKRSDARRPHGGGASPSQLPDLCERARSETQSFVKTTRKLELRELRAELSEDDQLLLVLRIDRELPWDAIARVFESSVPGETAPAAATLRKRFQRAKLRLATALRARRGDHD